jgi:hypothetical protein
MRLSCEGDSPRTPAKSSQIAVAETVRESGAGGPRNTELLPLPPPLLLLALLLPVEPLAWALTRSNHLSSSPALPAAAAAVAAEALDAAASLHVRWSILRASTARNRHCVRSWRRSDTWLLVRCDTTVAERGKG